MTQLDLVFLHQGIAVEAATRDDITLPVDEWAGYLLLEHHGSEKDLQATVDLLGALSHGPAAMLKELGVGWSSS